MTDIDYSPTINPEFIGVHEIRPYDAFEQALEEAELDHMEQMENDGEPYVYDDASEDHLTDIEADAMTLAGVYGDPEENDRDFCEDGGGDW